METWLSTFGVIFAIVDPFGYVPIFLSLTAGDSEVLRRKMIRKACATAFIVLTISTFIGQQVLSFFGISIPALQISGGLILLIIGFEMMKILPVVEKLSQKEETEAERKEDISIVPLAIPMLSGPAAIASVVVLSSRAQSFADYPVIISSILATLLITYFVLRSSSRLIKIIGVTGLNVMTRVMGLLLCAIAIQYVINGFLSVKHA
ncbi:MAG: MarC family protein [Proteobacteria bacterium]|nr:MarC family protein [Pseudomonadota bacterium]